MCYDKDVSDPYSQLNWTAGCHTADGTTALAFSRMRYARTRKGDFGRAARQRQVINAIVKRARQGYAAELRQGQKKLRRLRWAP